MQGLYIHVHKCMHLSNELRAKNGNAKTYPSSNTHQRDAAEAEHCCFTCTDAEPNEGDLVVIGRCAFPVSKMYVKT